MDIHLLLIDVHGFLFFLFISLSLQWILSTSFLFILLPLLLFLFFYIQPLQIPVVFPPNSCSVSVHFFLCNVSRCLDAFYFFVLLNRLLFVRSPASSFFLNSGHFFSDSEENLMDFVLYETIFFPFLPPYYIYVVRFFSTCLIFF